MTQEIKSKIYETFKESDHKRAIDILGSVTLQHVMTNSQSNLNNAWLSIIYLSKGSLGELKKLVTLAKVDFRDVIYWTILEKEKEQK